MTPFAVGGLTSTIFTLIMLALWIGMITAVVVVVLALRRWSFAARDQAEAFRRIAAAMERGHDPRAVGNVRSDAG